ncbi:hypothetical protein DRH29_04975, partial [candidate division Kazan bacterium]
QEEKEKAKMERLAKLGAVPESFEDFMKLEEVKKFYDWLRARHVRSATAICRSLHKICLDINIHPLQLLEQEGKEKLASYIADLLEEYSESSVNTIKGHIRLWYKFNEMQPPPTLALKRYKSKVAHLVWFDIEERFKILKAAKEMLKKPEEYDLVRAALMFLFYTGSRAEALTNVRFEERTYKYEVRGETIEVKAIIAVTQEKGRHEKTQWEKPIPYEIYVKYIKGRLPIAEKELKWLRKTLKEIYKKVLPKESIKYKFAVEGTGVKTKIPHEIHIWRHTAAIEFLNSTDWNVGLVSEILGWENPEILYQVYGRMSIEKKVAIIYKVPIEKPPFEFFYGEWEKKAKELALI